MSKELFNERNQNQAAKETDPRLQDGKVHIKVIINDGITVAVLADGEAEVEVEVIDVDADYGDYEALKSYQAELINDPRLKNVDYSVACFEKDGPDPII